MINKLPSWTDLSQLNLNVDKCVTVSYGRHMDNSHSYYHKPLTVTCGHCYILMPILTVVVMFYLVNLDIQALA